MSAPGKKLFLALAVGGLTLLPATPVGAYFHHASNVRFVEHSPQAFEAARRERKPVFLLISAVWCYWCKYFDEHVLREAEISRYLNRHYVSIFADHDRRADLTRKYVRGLPMIVLFDPDGRVRQSFAGVLKTEDFLSVLKRVEGEARTTLAEPRSTTVTAAPVPVTREAYRVLREGMLSFLDEHLDRVHGGFGTGDKYPHARLLAYLLEQHRATGDRRYLEAVEKSLDGVLRGIYDRADGGFFRFAEGREWREPHYEKLVHLNASLAAVFGAAHRVTGNTRYKEAADATLAYLLRTLHDAQTGGFYSSQTADPAYYRLPPAARRGARMPPVNRDKVTAWNAEAALAFLTLGQLWERQDLVDVALRTLDFMRRKLVTEKGAFQLYEHKTGRGQLHRQLEANAWAALAFLEGSRASRSESHRQVAERVLAYAMSELFDATRGAFIEERSSPLSLDANGIMAEALTQAHRLTGRAEYSNIARRVLASLGGPAHALLVDEGDAAAVARVADVVFYLKAYAHMVGQR